MSEQTPDVPSIWDDFLGVPQEVDWQNVISEPPDWYYPLVGKVAVATGGLERRFAQTALRLLGWSPGQGGELLYWLSSSARLRALLGAAKGLKPDFDALARELDTARSHRNEVVHVATGWQEWETPDEPSGWHYEHPQSGQRVYLTSQAKIALEKVLATICDLDQRVWELYLALSQPPKRAASSEA